MALGVALLACGGAGGNDGTPNFNAAPPFSGVVGASSPNGVSASAGANSVPALPSNSGAGGTSGEASQSSSTPLGNSNGNTSSGGSPSTPTGTAGTAGSGAAPGSSGTSSTGAAGSQSMPSQMPDPGAGSAGETTLPTPPGNAFFFDDFEAGAPGTKPAAWTTWIDYILTAANTPTSPEFALLDNSDQHSGKQSVHFHATGATSPAMLTLPLPANTSRLFLRVFLKSTVPLGARQADAVSNHETLLGLRGTPGDGNFELRFGEAKGALGYNMVGPDRSDAVSPPMAQWGQGPSMSANQWHCVELDFINDDPANPQAHASVDGTLVRSITKLSDWHVQLSGAGTQWLNGMFKEVILGWQSFSNAPANDVWMDDVVLSNSQIGCN